MKPFEINHSIMKVIQAIWNSGENGQEVLSCIFIEMKSSDYRLQRNGNIKESIKISRSIILFPIEPLNCMLEFISIQREDKNHFFICEIMLNSLH